MGTRYLIDTNVVSYYLKGALPQAAHLLLANILDDVSRVSVITHIELLVWNTDASLSNSVRTFIEESTVYNINRAIIDATVQVRKNHRLKLPDAIIAATAITNNLTLLSRNTADFEKIAGMKFINPWSL